jgi:hypothetical protein
MSYGGTTRNRLSAYGDGAAGVPQFFPAKPQTISTAYGLSGSGLQITAPTSGRSPLGVYRRRGPGPVSGYARPERLGVLPLAILAPVAGKLVGGLLHDNKDPQRLAQNQAWYTAAINGDMAALGRLADMSGHGTPGSGWATQTAQNDAFAKYNAAVQILNGQQAPTGTSNLMPVPPASGGAVSDFLTAVLATPGGQSIVNTVKPGLVTAGKNQAAAQIGSAIVNNPTLVAGGIAAMLFLTATLASRRH